VRARSRLAAIFLVCAAPLVLGWLAYANRWVPGAQGNYGELLAPRPFAGPLAALRGKWVLVTFDAASCPPSCERKLYVVRQLRRAQGMNTGRVERLWLVTDAGAPSARLLGAIEGSHVVAAPAQWAAQFPGEATAYIYLVDPFGNLMMRFPADPDPTRIVRDLERLLKYSRFG
jgi:hypothetical protein